MASTRLSSDIPENAGSGKGVALGRNFLAREA